MAATGGDGDRHRPSGAAEPGSGLGGDLGHGYDRECRLGAGRRAVGVLHEHGVGSGVVGLDAGDGVAGIGGVEQVRPVELPLVGVGRIDRGHRGEGHRASDVDLLRDGLRRQDGGIDAVEADVVERPIPAAGAGLEETEADRGPAVARGNTEDFDAFGLEGVVVDAAADVGGLNRGERSKNERAVVGGVGRSAVDRVHGGGHIDDAVGALHIGDAVLVVQEVGQREPVRALVDGVFHRAEAVLVLFVGAEEPEEDVRPASEVVVGRIGDLDLGTAAVVGLAVERVAMDEPVQQGAVQDDRVPVEAAGVQRVEAVAAYDHEVLVGIRCEVVQIKSRGQRGGEVGQGPAGGNGAFSGGFKILEVDRSGQGDGLVLANGERPTVRGDARHIVGPDERCGV